MQKLTRILISCSLILAYSTFAVGRAGSVEPGSLNIGELAPSLGHASWIKGTPIPHFTKGRVYVIEFWATWCEPCKEAIPHLTELAKKYNGSVDFVGIDVMESKEGARPKVESFVRSQGKQMDYSVVFDGPDHHLADSWLKASGEMGIPATFVVGKDGKVAWIGHPLNGLDQVLSQVVEDRFDSHAARVARDQAYGPTLATQKALAHKSYTQVVKLIDGFANQDPNALSTYSSFLFQALSHLDRPTFERRARQYLSQRGNSVDAYSMLCALIAGQTDLAPDIYRFGLVLADEGAKLKQREAFVLSLSVDISLHLKDRAEALRRSEATVKSADADPDCPDSFRRSAHKQLEELKAKR